MHKSFVIEKYKTNNYNYLNKNTKKFRRFGYSYKRNYRKKLSKNVHQLFVIHIEL